MRRVSTVIIANIVYELCARANIGLTRDIHQALEAASGQETSPLARSVLEQLQRNAALAEESGMAICQDTGMVVVFLDVGQEVQLTDGYVEDAINDGVRRAYADNYFRKSVVRSPLERENTGDNTPAVIHTRVVPGTKVRVRIAPKGFGSENMSQLAMLTPSQGWSGVRDFVVKTVTDAGGNPCPPLMVGIGIGGTMEKASLMAKEALLRPIDQRNAEPKWAAREGQLLEAINNTGIGPQGFGGAVTALGVNIEWYPTHIAGLPVAVNINCHAARHREAVI